MPGGCLEHSLGDKNAIPHVLSLFKNGRSRPQFIGRETCRGKDPTSIPTPARRLLDSSYVSRPHQLWWLYSVSEGMGHWGSPGSREAEGLCCPRCLVRQPCLCRKLFLLLGFLRADADSAPLPGHVDRTHVLPLGPLGHMVTCVHHEGGTEPLAQNAKPR